MVKSVIKEILIILLLVISIVLILGIIFYNYNPINKTVPSKVAEYKMSQEMEKELDETIEESKTQNIIKTYRVDASDLKTYEKSNDYDKGKINPFDKVGSDGTKTQENTQNGENNSNQSQGRSISSSSVETSKNQDINTSNNGKFGVDGNK